MARIAAVIPARVGSSRFPGKPLAWLRGIPVLDYVVRLAAACGLLPGAHVATCDGEIRDAAEAFGASVLMTSPDHERATDRVAEAAERLDADVVVMVQGDEPMVTAAMIEAAVGPLLAGAGVGCVNLARRFRPRGPSARLQTGLRDRKAHGRDPRAGE